MHNFGALELWRKTISRTVLEIRFFKQGLCRCFRPRVLQSLKPPLSIAILLFVNCSYKLYNDSYKFLPISLFSFGNFQQNGRLISKNICILFIANLSLLLRHAESNKFSLMLLLGFLSCSYYIFIFKIRLH